MSRPKTQGRREAKRREHRRYYAETAFLYKPRAWTEKEDRARPRARDSRPGAFKENQALDEGNLEPPLAAEKM